MSSFRIKNAVLDWSEHDQPRSQQFGDIYHSDQGEVGESEAVFINGNRLGERWKKLPVTGSCFTIGEIGFGSGLNFLLTWARWKQRYRSDSTVSGDVNHSRLHYVAFEKYPIRLAELERMHSSWPQLAALSEQLRNLYPDFSSSCHRIQLDDSVTLDLWIGDAQAQLANFMQFPSAKVDAWFLDGFSPRLNPELWNSELCQLIARHSATDATLSTYTVAGKVRRNLENAGFKVSKQTGFGKKRHMLSASRENSATTKATPARSWHSLPDNENRTRQAVIIGGGLAGCSLAYSLARRDWQVSLLESQDQILAGASGVRQLALRCRLFSRYSAEAEFFLQSFLFASRQFRQLNIPADCGWHGGGVIQLEQALNKRSAPELQRWLELYPSEVLQELAEGDCEEVIGTAIGNSALLFPGGGWVDPTALNRRYLDHPNIKVRSRSEVTRLEHRDKHWALLDSKGSELACSETVIIANGSGARLLEQLSSFPMELVRGQTSQVEGTHLSKNLGVVVCGSRSVFPAFDGLHTLAASYSEDTGDLAASSEDDRENLSAARGCFTDPEFLADSATTGDIALRCNMPDRLPLIGMVPDVPRMKETYSKLARNARVQIRDAGSYLPGLYLSVAHGSNGLATCPFASEYLASLICGEPLPLSEEVSKLLNPTRFILRDLKRQKTE